MAQKYHVIWKSINLNKYVSQIRSETVEEITFKNQYVMIELEQDEVVYIPYYRIYDITRIGRLKLEDI